MQQTLGCTQPAKEIQRCSPHGACQKLQVRNNPEAHWRGAALTDLPDFALSTSIPASTMPAFSLPLRIFAPAPTRCGGQS
jgi:hypothetical protein